MVSNLGSKSKYKYKYKYIKIKKWKPVQNNRPFKESNNGTAKLMKICIVLNLVLARTRGHKESVWLKTTWVKATAVVFNEKGSM
jgi:hypothetical protein